MENASNLRFQFTCTQTEVRKITDRVFWAPFLQRIMDKSELNEKLVFERTVFLSEELKLLTSMLIRLISDRCSGIYKIDLLTQVLSNLEMEDGK